MRRYFGLMLLLVAVSEGSGFAQETTSPLTISRQGSFFVGGRELKSDTLSTRPDYPMAGTGTVSVDQVYVQYQVPVQARDIALTLIHGCCLTGKTWETTPDGRMGWDEYFVRKGYPVYVIDQAARGRSAFDSAQVGAVKLGRAPAAGLPSSIWASHEFAWEVFRFGPEYPKVNAGLKFPLASVAEFWKQMAPDWNSSLPTPNPTVVGLSELANRLGRTALISHSQSGVYPFQVVDLSAQGISAIIAIEPGGCPNSSNLHAYVPIPALIVWGDYVESSPRWAPRLKACRSFADTVNQLGGHVENLVLPEVGIRGNSHMLMQDSNNLEIADRLIDWLDRSVAGQSARCYGDPTWYTADGAACDRETPRLMPKVDALRTPR
ncbi:MAG: esterase [Nitrospira sp.]